jgi:hypothetical protein
MGIKERERRVEVFFDGLFIRCIVLERAIYGDLFPVVPNIENRNEVTPWSVTKTLGTVSDFISTSLHLLARVGVWGRGRRLSPLPQIAL